MSFVCNKSETHAVSSLVETGHRNEAGASVEPLAYSRRLSLSALLQWTNRKIMLIVSDDSKLATRFNMAATVTAACQRLVLTA